MSESDAVGGWPTTAFISYAQNHEDVSLKRALASAEPGFYFDVGAYPPVEGPVTTTFHDRGWSGINVEPGSVFKDLAAERTSDVNLKMAVLRRDGEIPFAESAVDRGMSRVVVDGAPLVSDAEVCDTLEGIVGAHGRGRQVDFLR